MYSLFNLRASIDFYFLLYLNEAEKHCGKSVALDATCKHTKKKKQQNKVLNSKLNQTLSIQKAVFFQTRLKWSNLNYSSLLS